MVLLYNIIETFIDVYMNKIKNIILYRYEFKGCLNIYFDIHMLSYFCSNSNDGGGWGNLYLHQNARKTRCLWILFNRNR